MGNKLTKAQIRKIFLESGFTIKEGYTDLKPYVYQAAAALLKEQERQNRRVHSAKDIKHLPEQERNMVKYYLEQEAAGFAQAKNAGEILDKLLSKPAPESLKRTRRSFQRNGNDFTFEQLCANPVYWFSMMQKGGKLITEDGRKWYMVKDIDGEDFKLSYQPGQADISTIPQSFLQKNPEMAQRLFNRNHLVQITKHGEQFCYLVAERKDVHEIKPKLSGLNPKIIMPVVRQMTL